MNVVDGKSISEYFSAKKKYVEAKQQVVPGQSEALKIFLLSLIADLEASPMLRLELSNGGL